MIRHDSVRCLQWIFYEFVDNIVLLNNLKKFHQIKRTKSYEEWFGHVSKDDRVQRTVQGAKGEDGETNKRTNE